MEKEKVKKHVKERYAKIANSNQSCCSSSCCQPSSQGISQIIGYSKNDLEIIPRDSVLGLGCGNPVALASLRQGEVVLDLGSGAGIDVFLASKKVGDTGKAIGIDMTKEMIKKAKKIATQKGYKNVEFKLGEIESLPIEDNSIDVVISNCVINLCSDKEKAFKEIFRVLKPGGRLMISDLVTKEELPDEVRKSFDAWAECIGGALQKEVYLRIIRNVGFLDVEILSETPYLIDVSEEIKGKIASISVKAIKNSK
jgi:ubiquinone/menaquinone biosynthesis C-methylase UbiE